MQIDPKQLVRVHKINLLVLHVLQSELDVALVWIQVGKGHKTLRVVADVFEHRFPSPNAKRRPLSLGVSVVREMPSTPPLIYRNRKIRVQP